MHGFEPHRGQSDKQYVGKSSLCTEITLIDSSIQFQTENLYNETILSMEFLAKKFFFNVGLRLTCISQQKYGQFFGKKRLQNWKL